MADLLPSEPLQGVWTDRLGHLLWEVATMVESELAAALADTQLSLAGNGMLDIVTASPGVTVAEIARRVPKTQQAVSQVAARLEKLGLLERRLGSGRGVGLYVTDAGRAAHDEGHAREEQVEARLRERLGDERYDTLRQLLREARETIVEDA
jgi:DNA-binding MarR family transcriptional regulator